MPSSLPQPTCIACRRKGDQSSFYRVSLGRSAYICKTLACVTIGLTKDKLTRALKHPISEDERNKLLEHLSAALSSPSGLSPLSSLLSPVFSASLLSPLSFY